MASKSSLDQIRLALRNGADARRGDLARYHPGWHAAYGRVRLICPRCHEGVLVYHQRPKSRGNSMAFCSRYRDGCMFDMPGLPYVRRMAEIAIGLLFSEWPNQTWPFTLVDRDWFNQAARELEMPGLSSLPSCFRETVP